VKRTIIVTIVALLAWQVYTQYRAGVFDSVLPPQAVAPVGTRPAVSMQCDHRTHCAQMTSCAEAKYFQKHCTDADLEIDSAGVPCPRRWCTSPNAP
jgi:hypothetical protein